ncbi:MAG: Rrf2 family transcriptional regulator [Ignavibacteriales bacterium]|nr:Rrf2 family transcriptional regulator [Ignavibacteriales bacterium]
MSIIFSRKCEYALQAVSYLALQPVGKKTSIRELTRNLKIPYHFLAKILQSLTYKKLLVSQKGPSGGFALALSPDKITLFHIVDAIDGSGFTNKCVMGFPECSGKSPCAVHKHWAKMREGIYSMLVSENIADMAKAMKRPEYRA